MFLKTSLRLINLSIPTLILKAFAFISTKSAVVSQLMSSESNLMRATIPLRNKIKLAALFIKLVII